MLHTCMISHFVSNSLRPYRSQPARFLCPWDSPGKNTGVGGHSLFQGFVPTQGLNPGRLHCRHILYCLSHQESPQYNMQLLNFKAKKILYLVSIWHLPIGNKNDGATFKGIKTKIEKNNKVSDKSIYCLGD